MVKTGALLHAFAAELGAAVKVSAAHIVSDLLTAEHVMPLADRCDEMGRQLRLYAHRRDQPAIEEQPVDEELADAARGALIPDPHAHAYRVGDHVEGVSHQTGLTYTGPIVHIGPSLTAIQVGAQRLYLRNDSVRLAKQVQS